MKKLAIVGAEPRTRNNAPFDDPDYDIWVISNWANAEWVKRCDAVIEIHNPSLYKNHPKDAKYWDWLKENETATIYMQSPDRLVKKSVELPLNDLLALTGNVMANGQGARVINSSIAFALALAIHLEYKEIDVYGVEMALNTEYRSQQPIFTFWVGYAAGRGIKLNINCSEGLFLQSVYGYESTFDHEKMYSLLDGLKSQRAELDKQGLMVDGASMMIRQLLEEQA